MVFWGGGTTTTHPYPNSSSSQETIKASLTINNCTHHPICIYGHHHQVQVKLCEGMRSNFVPLGESGLSLRKNKKFIFHNHIHRTKHKKVGDNLSET